MEILCVRQPIFNDGSIFFGAVAACKANPVSRLKEGSTVEQCKVLDCKAPEIKESLFQVWADLLFWLLKRIGHRPLDAQEVGRRVFRWKLAVKFSTNCKVEISF